MQKTADILLETKCQRKKQSGGGTEEVIYIQRRGILHWGRGSTFSHVPIPKSHFPKFHPNYSILSPSLKKSLDVAHSEGQLAPILHL